MKKIILLASVSAALCINAEAQNRISVNTSKVTSEVPQTLFGVFIEDINYAADGGLYAELVKNRSFEFENPLQGWKVNGGCTIMNDGPFSNNPHYLHVQTSHRAVPAIMENEGFLGMGIHQDEAYVLSFWARSEKKSYINWAMTDPSLQKEDQSFISGSIHIYQDGWNKYSIQFTSPVTVEQAHLRLMVWSGEADIEHVSLFPVETFNHRENGLRADIAQAIADLHPGVFRFPGGCIVEGPSVDKRYRWKDSVGPVEQRPLQDNRWAGSMGGRYFPDYYMSCGLGFYEYFLFAEDIGAEPLPILSAGLACQFQNEEKDNPHTPVDSLDFLIQDALDLIEFANADTDTKWGGLRAEMGHPEPFGLKYLGIGNENWTRGYPARLVHFVKAIREKYPEIQIVGSAGASPTGEEFETLWKEMNEIGVDLVDEHFYMNEDFFMGAANRYDSRPRAKKGGPVGAKVFVGEYACHPDGKKYNSYRAAIMEAVAMTGFERNSDIIGMTAYAPLLAHRQLWQWRPDLIWFDNLATYTTSSYLVQQLFSLYKGSKTLSISTEGSVYASAVYDRESDSYIVKCVNPSESEAPVEVILSALPRKYTASKATLITLGTSEDHFANESLQECSATVTTTELEGIRQEKRQASVNLTLAPETMSILVIGQ